jgi:hypothetical protein
MIMRLRLLLIVSLFASTASAGIVLSDKTMAPSAAYAGYYHSARRVIQLADGSDLILYEPLPRDERPPAIDAFMISARGVDEDRSFRLSVWIPEQIQPDTYGQITGAAMSSDHRWLAFVGGWAGVRDHRGHSGVFLLQQEPKSGYWRLKSWFDVPGVSLGDMAFGPDDTLLLLAQKGRPEGGPAPILTVFSYSGQNLGWFLDDPEHGNWMVTPCTNAEGRIVRIDEKTYGIYDPESSQVRTVEVTHAAEKVAVRQTKSVPLPFPRERVNLVGFDPRPDGRVTIARSIFETLPTGKRRLRTVITVLNPNGQVADEWQAPNNWTYGYASGGTLHGYSVIVNRPEIKVSTVTVR